VFIIKAVGVLSRRRRRRRLADGNGCCLLLRSSTPTETRLVLFFCCCCCCCCEGVDRARIIVVIVIIFFGSVYCVVVVLGGQKSLFKDVFCARNTTRCENVTTIFELENSFENVPQNARRHNTIQYNTTILERKKERKKERNGGRQREKDRPTKRQETEVPPRPRFFVVSATRARANRVFSVLSQRGRPSSGVDVAHVVLERRELRVL
tara:strand:- start:901 stop:1524 length:624 start_codon:yes stop_codon:yes gene_type:complete